MPKNSLKNFLLDAEVRKKTATQYPTLNTKHSAILCVDYGEKYCGLAWSPDGITVLPLKVIQTSTAENTIHQTMHEKKIQQLVFGLPLAPDGGENHICKMIKNFAQKFDSHNISIHFINERGSSQATIKKQNQRIDDQAALNILRYYLEK